MSTHNTTTKPADEAPAAGQLTASVGAVENSIVVVGHGNTVTVAGTTLAGSPHGAVYVRGVPEAGIIPRPIPIFRRPPGPELLLDRTRERAACAEVDSSVVELFGGLGFGKSFLLAFLSHELPAAKPTGFSHGVALCNAEGLSFEELLFEIWSLFYDTTADWTVKPPTAQLRNLLSDVAALLLLDDVALSENELTSLTVALPLSLLIPSTESQTVYGFGRSLHVTGLPREHVLDLAKATLGRLCESADGLDPEWLNEVWLRSEGNPQLIVREVSRWSRNRSPVPHPNDSPEADRVMEVVQALGKPVPGDLLPDLTGLPGAGELAKSLAESGELLAHSPRYTLPLPEHGLSVEVVNGHCEHALRVLADQDMARTRTDLVPLALHLLEWAAGRPEIAQDSLTVARGLSDQLMAAGRWDMWAAALRAALTIAESSGDFDAISWARHNLGARALGEGELFEARSQLQAALLLRLEQHNGAAAAVSRDLYDEAVSRLRDLGTDFGTSASGPGDPPMTPASGPAAADPTVAEPRIELSHSRHPAFTVTLS